MPLPSISTAAGSVKNALTNALMPKSVQKTPGPNGKIMGPDSKSPIQQFHDLLVSDFGNIPIATQWVLQIDQLPVALNSNLNSVDVNTLEPGNWFVGRKARDIRRVLEEGVFMDRGVCIFTQGVQTPRENVNVQALGISPDHSGGLIPGPVLTSRSEPQPLNIAFLETNYSFIDFVIRPWVIYTSHYGLIARTPDDPKNIKTTLQLFFYDRWGPGSPKVRKIFRFYNAAPINVEGIISTWDNADVKQVYTSWTYSHYDVSGETYEDWLTDFRNANKVTDTIKSGAETFSSTKAIDAGSISQPIPSESVGSESFSNPTAFEESTSNLGSQSGAFTGGSFASDFSTPGGI
jgi:hypothetical protein